MTVIGIIGASGGLGRCAARYVLDSHPASDRRLFSRSPESLNSSRMGCLSSTRTSTNLAS